MTRAQLGHSTNGPSDRVRTMTDSDRNDETGDQPSRRGRRTRRTQAAGSSPPTPKRTPSRHRKPVTVQGVAEESTGPARDPKTGRISGGNPGNRGGPGRPSKALKTRQAYIGELTSGRALEIAQDDKHPAWPMIHRMSHEYTLGKPEHSVKLGGAAVLVIRKASEDRRGEAPCRKRAPSCRTRAQAGGPAYSSLGLVLVGRPPLSGGRRGFGALPN